MWFNKKQKKEKAEESEEFKALYEEGQKLLKETLEFIESLQTTA